MAAKALPLQQFVQAPSLDASLINEAGDGFKLGSGTPIGTPLSQDEYLHYADKAVTDDFGNLVPIDF